MDKIFKYTPMKQKVVPYVYGNPMYVYVYGPSHMHMHGQYMHTGQNTAI